MDDSEFYKLVGNAYVTLQRVYEGEPLPHEAIRQQVLKTMPEQLPVELVLSFDERFEKTMNEIMEDNVLLLENNTFYEKVGLPVPQSHHDTCEQIVKLVKSSK